jgi:tRNA A37 threonylcarbamoyladenosine biosynthesis protein TsaE
VTSATTTEPTWLTAVRLRAERHMLWCRDVWSRHHYVDEQSLAITHSEVERALRAPEDALADERAFQADDAAAQLTAAIAALERRPPDPRWAALVTRCALSDGERALAACALAAEAQPALRRVFAYLQDGSTPVDASPATVAALWCTASAPVIGPGSPLVRWRLARPLDDGREPESSLTGWVADPAVLRHLLGGDPRDAGGGLLGVRIQAPRRPLLFAAELDDIAAFADALIGAADGGAVEVELSAPAGSGKTALAAQVARRLGHGLVAVDARAVASRPDPATTAVRELRQAELDDDLLIWRHAGALPEAARDAVSGLAPLVLLAGPTPLAEPAGPNVVRRTYELEPLDRERRLALWAALDAGPAPAPVADWSLRAGEVVAARRAAVAGEEAVRQVCRRLLFQSPSELITRLRLPYTWDDLVVPDALMAHLRELEAQSRARSEVLDGWGLSRLTSLGRGVSAMFAGPSGTGKTMAAQVLARELGLELYRVDLAGVVNKYIGETEKHLRELFGACERAPVMLFFDEADALFGRRMQVSDAHDRFANIEVDYLLQRMEAFDGIAVLATNRKGDIDTAFMRRLRFLIDFAPPTVAERERLWRLALQDSVATDGRPLTEPLDWAALARDLDLTGAGIKSAALAAAFLARSEGSRVGARHIIAAARRELQKHGVIVRANRPERTAAALARPAGAANGHPEPLSAGEIERMVDRGLR